MSPSEIYANQIMPSVPGWFYMPDVLCFLAVDKIQKDRNFSGDLVEVGVYCGKSLGLICTLRQPAERVYGFDLFTGEASLEKSMNTVAKAAGSLDGVEFITANSVELSKSELEKHLPNPVRFLHVDAGHEFHEALSDLTKFGAQVSKDGVIAVDDYYDRDFPGVCAATNELVRSSDFVPFLGGLIKVYLCHKDRITTYISALLEFPQFQTGARIARYMNRPMLITCSPKPLSHKENMDALLVF